MSKAAPKALAYLQKLKCRAAVFGSSNLRLNSQINDSKETG